MAKKSKYHTLLKKLGDNATATSEGGWDEDPSDRKVIVTDNELELTGTFEHMDDRGGRHRVTCTFQVHDDRLVDMDDEDDTVNSCPLGDEAALQEFVNKCFRFCNW